MSADAHGFADELRFSQAHEDEPSWAAAYRQRWPALLRVENTNGDRAAQLAGIDRRIHLPGGATRTIDEKVRRQKYYGDVLLELVSDWRRRTPGWSRDPHKTCDYVAYLWKPDRMCQLLGLDEVRHALAGAQARWLQHASHNLGCTVAQWMDERPPRNRCHRGRNRFSLIQAVSRESGRTWTTLSIAVPIEVIKQASDAVNVLIW